jgi:NADP-dependent aldehyde dehydrogenase
MTTATIQGVDPRTGAPVGNAVPETDAASLESVLGGAAAAAPAFGRSTPDVRAALLRALADALDAASDELVPLAIAESGLPEARLAGEVGRTSGQLRLFADVVTDGGYLDVIIDPADPTSAPPRPDLRRWLEPLGPVLVFAASNFPFAFSVLGGDTASTLAAGCPVVVKAHSSHPGLSSKVASLASKVVAQQGLPAGVFGMVLGDGPGLAALNDPRVRAAGFTGSTAGGRFLFDVASRRPDPIPFYGELGSINPAIVTPAAAAARGGQIATGFVASMTLGAGQFCTKPGLLFLPAGHAMTEALSAALAGATPMPMLNQRIRNQLTRGLADLSDHAEVATIAAAPDPSDASAEGSWASGIVFGTSASAFQRDADVLAAEYFGPNSLMVEYGDAAELMRALARVDGTLTATVHAEPDDPFPVSDVVATLSGKAGRIIYNGWPTGVAVTWAMQHGGPWPATTSAGFTSVGATAIQRWIRPVCYQDVPESLLPPALRMANLWRLPRRVDGRLVIAD